MDADTRPFGDRESRSVLRTGYVALFVIGALSLLAIGAIVLSPEDVLATSQVPFDSRAWKAKEDPWWSVPMRVRMLSALSASGKLATLERARVLEILGPPDRCERIERPRRDVWFAGPWRTDDLWLAVDVSEDGLVVDASIVK